MLITKGYKVTKPNGECRPDSSKPGIIYEVGKTYEVQGKLIICENGIHFCQKVANCFAYYDFNPENKVFEIEAYGDLVSDDGNIKNAASKVKVIRQLTWGEMLDLANTGSGNTGINNAGYANAGNRNAGNRNAGYANAGNYNAGNYNAGNDNAGNRNAGYANAGYANAGNYNAGNRNAGYANAGNDNAGAFNTLQSPYMLFNKPSSWTYENFINSIAFQLLQQVNTTQWIADYQMSEEEKKLYPYYVTTKGYIKNIPFKDAFQNAWHNWTKDSQKEFKNLPNFDAVIFEEITGVKID